jgi:hypothetical protein
MPTRPWIFEKYLKGKEFSRENGFCQVKILFLSFYEGIPTYKCITTFTCSSESETIQEYIIWNSIQGGWLLFLDHEKAPSGLPLSYPSSRFPYFFPYTYTSDHIVLINQASRDMKKYYLECLKKIVDFLLSSPLPWEIKNQIVRN